MNDLFRLHISLLDTSQQNLNFFKYLLSLKKKKKTIQNFFTLHLPSTTTLSLASSLKQDISKELPVFLPPFSLLSHLNLLYAMNISH